MLKPKGMPREKATAALRCLILLTVFAMAWLQPTGRNAAFDLVIIIGGAYVLATTFIPWSRYDVRRVTIIMLAVDVLLITALIAVQSGVRSEYYLLYYLPILHASVRLSLRDAAGTCALAAASYLLVGILERPDATITTSVISRVLTFAVSAGLLAAFFIMLSRERRAFDRLTKHYEDATRAKSEFLSRVSHEFRTPLTAIVGFSQLLYEHDRQLDPERQHEYLTVIREQSQELARMIEDMLDITRLDDGRLKLNRGAYKVSDIVDGALMLLESAADRERVAVAVGPTTPMVWVDRGEMEQAISRILHAALEAAAEDGRVSLSAVSAPDRSDDVRLTIRAPGLDLNSEDLALVFGPSAAVLMERPSSGRSLGLAVAKALVELHGGTIWLEDDRGEGGAVHLTIARYRAGAQGARVIVGETSAWEEEAEADEAEGGDSGRRPNGTRAHT